jgi:hypothetical protein
VVSFESLARKPFILDIWEHHLTRLHRRIPSGSEGAAALRR